MLGTAIMGTEKSSGETQERRKRISPRDRVFFEIRVSREQSIIVITINYPMNNVIRIRSMQRPQRPLRPPLPRIPIRGQRPSFSPIPSRPRQPAPSSSSTAPVQAGAPPHPLQPLIMQVLQELRMLAGKVTRLQDQHAQLIQKTDDIAKTLEDQARRNFVIDKRNFQASKFKLLLEHCCTVE